MSKHFPVRGGFIGKAGVVRAVDDVSFSVDKGEVLGIVGESGCGKSTTARLVIGLIEPDAGSIVLDGEKLGAALSLRDLRRRVQMVFQDSYASLNPRLTIEASIAFGPMVHGVAADGGARARARPAAQGRARSGDCSRIAIRTSCPAASASASTSRARSRSRRGWCCSTRRCRRSTSRSRRRCSTC